MSYLIPSGTARCEIIVLKSRFIATAGFVDTPETAKAFLDHIRQEMPDANHHVHAFRVGHGNTVTEGVSDDGEPSGTSGPPILSILRGTDLGDVIIVVTRYFGGTKLGTGGLVRAYSDAARCVLGQLPTEFKIDKTRVLVEIPYSYFDTVKRMLAEAQAEIIEEEFAASVTMEFAIPTSNLADVETTIRDATAGQVELIRL